MIARSILYYTACLLYWHWTGHFFNGELKVVTRRKWPGGDLNLVIHGCVAHSWYSRIVCHCLYLWTYIQKSLSSALKLMSHWLWKKIYIWRMKKKKIGHFCSHYLGIGRLHVLGMSLACKLIYSVVVICLNVQIHHNLTIKLWFAQRPVMISIKGSYSLFRLT